MIAEAIIAVVATWSLVGGLGLLAPRIGLVDRPNERSSHTRVTPRGGGIGIVVVVLGGLLVSKLWGHAVWNGWVYYWLAGLAVAGLSLWDDFRSLGAGIRLGGHLLAAFSVVWGIGMFGTLSGAIWSDALLTLLWLVGLTNVYNFMDGSDGIAGTQGVIAGAAWMIAGSYYDAFLVTLLGALVTGSCLGFLWHNWSPAKIFMGDVGSAFLGFTFAAIPLLVLAETRERIGSSDGRIPVFAAMVVWPFIGDGFLTFLRRALRREKVWAAHRSHLYQRLIRSGWSHAGIAILYGAWAVSCAAVGLGYLVERFSCWAVIAWAGISLGGMFVYTCQAEARAKEAERRAAV